MESHGALVGWAHYDAGEHLMLRLETMPTLDAVEKREPDYYRLLLSKQQSCILGHYLIKISGESHYVEDDGWFKRLFG